MSTTLNKRVGSSLLTDVIIFVSLILCLGSIYFFIMLNQNHENPSDSPHNTVNGPSSGVPEIVENMNLEDAIKELKWAGCRIISLKTKAYLDKPNYVNYNDFKSRALDSKIVFVSPSEAGTFLLVQINNVQWVWTPI